ncbi:transposase family protein [Beggiatoa alba B18LD]|uniref:Transposase family protein n=1 Tax=Beggiatoa alba B18LD TaxID=395493 RepID=I3CJD5_9GAMM|nr:IS982 family transposase [Beggiatoa alba]EIJ43728.1 transposase family protein [Beggiatoa alba B18LD]
MDMITILFCSIDDFCKWFIPLWEQMLLEEGNPKKSQRDGTMSPSEVMTLLVLFHQSNQRHFKGFYTHYVPQVLGRAFPKRVSAYLHSRRVNSRGIAFIDSTPLKVCHNRRISHHKTFANLAQRGKNSIGWYFGFKLHLVIDDTGELISFFLTAANFDDRKGLRAMTQFIQGKLYGDKGYISKALKATLKTQGIELITGVRKNMKKESLSEFDTIMLKKRSLIETVIGQLKSFTQIEHTRHRSVLGFMVNVIAGLIAYTWKLHKPSLMSRINPKLDDGFNLLNPSQPLFI